MEKKAYRIPLSVTVSRRTGEVTRIDWCDNGTEEEFRQVVEWMIDAGRAGEDAFRGAAAKTLQK